MMRDLLKMAQPRNPKMDALQLQCTTHRVMCFPKTKTVAKFDHEVFVDQSWSCCNYIVLVV